MHAPLELSRRLDMTDPIFRRRETASEFARVRRPGVCFSSGVVVQLTDTILYPMNLSSAPGRTFGNRFLSRDHSAIQIWPAVSLALAAR